MLRRVCASRYVHVDVRLIFLAHQRPYNFVSHRNDMWGLAMLALAFAFLLTDHPPANSRANACLLNLLVHELASTPSNATAGSSHNLRQGQALATSPLVKESVDCASISEFRCRKSFGGKSMMIVVKGFRFWGVLANPQGTLHPWASGWRIDS